MTTIDKLIYLISALDLTEKAFLKEYKISKKDFKMWKNGEKSPQIADISYLCDRLELSCEDFINDSSTVSYADIKDGEHICEGKNTGKSHTKPTIYEDFPREDYARYEEKD